METWIEGCGKVRYSLLAIVITIVVTRHKTQADPKQARLSTAYAAFMAGVAQNVSDGDLASVIEAKGLITLYADAGVVEDLAEFEGRALVFARATGS